MKNLKIYLSKLSDMLNSNNEIPDWLQESQYEIVFEQLKDLYSQMDEREQIIIDIINKNYGVKI